MGVKRVFGVISKQYYTNYILPHFLKRVVCIWFRMSR